MSCCSTVNHPVDILLFTPASAGIGCCWLLLVPSLPRRRAPRQKPCEWLVRCPSAAPLALAVPIVRLVALLLLLIDHCATKSGHSAEAAAVGTRSLLHICLLLARCLMGVEIVDWGSAISCHVSLLSTSVTTLRCLTFAFSFATFGFSFVVLIVVAFARERVAIR